MHVKTHHPEHHKELREMYSKLKKTAVKREIVQQPKGKKKAPAPAPAATPPRSHHPEKVTPPRRVGPGPVPEHGRYPPEEKPPAAPPGEKKPVTVTPPEGAGGESPAGSPGEDGDFHPIRDFFDWLNSP
jgi:hypothetical protein